MALQGADQHTFCRVPQNDLAERIARSQHRAIGGPGQGVGLVSKGELHFPDEPPRACIPNPHKLKTIVILPIGATRRERFPVRCPGNDAYPSAVRLHRAEYPPRRDVPYEHLPILRPGGKAERRGTAPGIFSRGRVGRPREGGDLGLRAAEGEGFVGGKVKPFDEGHARAGLVPRQGVAVFRPFYQPSGVWFARPLADGAACASAKGEHFYCAVRGTHRDLSIVP